MLRKIGLSLTCALFLACADSLARDDETATTTEPVAAAAAEPAAAPQPAKTKDPSPVVAGRVSGRITLDGKAPEPVAVDMAADPVCQGMHADGYTHATVRTGDGGGLADVFVQLVVDGDYDAPETPVEIDQRGCTYHPHVLGVMKKQDIKILNSDPTLHNIHAVPKVNKEFNVGMPPDIDPITKSFKKEEDAITIKCDVHPWMAAFVFVTEHPFYAVTDDDGAFAIDTEGLEDGEYAVKVWHESLGTKEGKVTVKDGAATYDLAFKR